MTDSVDTFFDLSRQVYYLSRDIYGEKYNLGHFFQDITRHYPDFVETDLTKMTNEGLLKAIYGLMEELRWFRE